MASDYYKLVGHENPHSNYGSVTFTDKDGSVREAVRGVPTNVLSAEERKSLKERGFIFESSSKSEAEEAEAAGAASDVTGTAPVFGQVPGESNQPRDTGTDQND